MWNKQLSTFEQLASFVRRELAGTELQVAQENNHQILKAFEYDIIELSMELQMIQNSQDKEVKFIDRILHEDDENFYLFLFLVIILLFFFKFFQIFSIASITLIVAHSEIPNIWPNNGIISIL